MAALMSDPTAELLHDPRRPRAGGARSGALRADVRPRLALVPPPARRAPSPSVRKPAQTSAATYWRRRLVVVIVAAVVVLAAGRAGAALGSTPLAAPERGPSVAEYVVKPGDSLWTIAGLLAPDEDPREVVAALVAARGNGPLLTGETLRWQR